MSTGAATAVVAPSASPAMTLPEASTVPIKPAIKPASVSQHGSSSKATPVLFDTVDGSSEGDRIIIYGPGGIGKTTLALQAPGPIGFFDLDRSLPKLKRAGIRMNDVRSVKVESAQDLHAALCAPGWDDIKTIVIDSGTKAEELHTEWVIQNVKTRKGDAVKRIEDYGYGIGNRHVYDQFVLLLSHCDNNHVLRGRNVIIICHESCTKKPNPGGEDYLHYVPQLQASDKCSSRERARNWGDHLLFVSYNISVEDNKATGNGSRSIYTCEMPTHLAKSRTLKGIYPYTPDNGAEFWAKLFGTAPSQKK